MKALDILIPTYNRAEFLEKNLERLINNIESCGFVNMVSIIISNNCSADDTEAYLKSKNVEYLKVFNQPENIGLEKNALFCLEKSTAKYVMYLGDDDYIHDDYLMNIISIINSEDDISLIIPSFYCVDINGEKVRGGRDIGFPQKEFSPSFKTTKYFALRGHQLSGLFLKREGLLESYKSRNVNNLYPFVYFTLMGTLNGKAVHYPQFPVEVTLPGQSNKDWSYGDDGLLDHMFNNYKCFSELTLLQRFELEIQVLKEQPWRFLTPFKTAPLKFITSVVKSKNTTILTKFSYLPMIIIYSFRAKLKRYVG